MSKMYQQEVVLDKMPLWSPNATGGDQEAIDYTYKRELLLDAGCVKVAKLLQGYQVASKLVQGYTNHYSTVAQAVI